MVCPDYVLASRIPFRLRVFHEMLMQKLSQARKRFLFIDELRPLLSRLYGYAAGDVRYADPTIALVLVLATLAARPKGVNAKVFLPDRINQLPTHAITPPWAVLFYSYEFATLHGADSIPNRRAGPHPQG